MAFAFPSLLVYQRALDFADRAWSLTLTIPVPYRFLSDQLNQALVSIEANIAEGNGRGTPVDRMRFLRIARGSLLDGGALIKNDTRRSRVEPTTHESNTTNFYFRLPICDYPTIASQD